ncbi:lysophospholipase-like protein 1 isoform X2 [Gouania willdenowi]|uniref:lysophospholipase-like protein 1 isoform X2 n=1 Tax=Gouania willdenowi TaxID=441366 RepID=UPI00105646ED|nr:lysophospholipase-like protein 1 isoform X2 [Gouania willdenowi]
MAAVRKLQLCAVSPTGKHTGSVIFLHGSGDTGQGLRTWVRDVMGGDLAFKHIRVIYPTAPARPYTPMHGAISTVWFDRYKISQDSPEHLESINSMCHSLGSVIDDEVRAGIPKHRMIIGGFSMGGAMAFHLVCRYHPDVAGVFALSSFLNRDSVAFQATEDRLRARLPLPELLQCHGTSDELVLHQWGEQTSGLLHKAGISTAFHSFPGPAFTAPQQHLHGRSLCPAKGEGHGHR